MNLFLATPPHRVQLPEEQIDETYRSLRTQVFVGTFVGYVGYYLVRRNFSLAMPYFQELGFGKAELGFAFACNATAYGFSKFIMGGISDRSDVRKFMALGLVLASLATMLAGTALGTSSVVWMSLFQALVGWFGGMGHPSSGRAITHWFSANERGIKLSIWNTSCNFGGGSLGVIAAWGVTFALSLGLSIGLSQRLGMFWLPAAIAIMVAIIIYLLVRDTPQSCGLPNIEEHRNDYPYNYNEHAETVLKTKDIFKYVVFNKQLWIVSVASAFFYFIRFGILDWSPTYLTEVKHYNIKEMGLAYALYEWAAIPGTILCGWLSDTVFKRRRAIGVTIYMVLIMVAIFVYWKNMDNKLLDGIALVSIGFLIYSPMFLVGLLALDFSSKNTVGTTWGFMGIFGYIFGTSILANIVMGRVIQSYGWDAGFQMLVAACLITIALMAITHWQEQRTGQRTDHNKQNEE